MSEETAPVRPVVDGSVARALARAHGEVLGRVPQDGSGTGRGMGS
jgi:hypothetical protein